MDQEIYFNEENYLKVIDSLEKEKIKNKSLSNIALKDIDSWKLFQ
jgi:hypothetical protein